MAKSVIHKLRQNVLWANCVKMILFLYQDDVALLLLLGQLTDANRWSGHSMTFGWSSWYVCPHNIFENFILLCKSGLCVYTHFHFTWTSSSMIHGWFTICDYFQTPVWLIVSFLIKLCSFNWFSNSFRGRTFRQGHVTTSPIPSKDLLCMGLHVKGRLTS